MGSFFGSVKYGPNIFRFFPQIAGMGHTCYRLLLLLLLWGCQSSQDSPLSLPTYTDAGHLRMVVEIPAGTNHRVAYDTAARTFAPRAAGEDLQRLIFLPYPANYGFVPSTRVPQLEGHQAMPALLLAESLPTGISMAVKPLAVAQMQLGSDTIPQLVVIPAYQQRRILPDSTWADLQQQRPEVQQILSLWLDQHRASEGLRLLRWSGTKAAQQEVQRYALEPIP